MGVTLRRLPSKLRLAVGLLLVALAIGVPALPLAADPVVIAADGFETGAYQGGSGWTAAWNVSTAVSIVSDQHPRSGGRHLELRGSAVASRPVDLAGWSEVELSFWAKTRSLDSGDYVVAEVSPDGLVWRLLEVWTAGDAPDRYYRYEYILPAADGWDRLYIRFLSQMDQATDYFYVDDVLVQGEPVPQGAPRTRVPPPEPAAAPIAPVVSNLAAGSGGIAIDGEFSHWAGYPCLADPPGDASKSRGDLSAFCWFSDFQARTNYFMIERYPAREVEDEDGPGSPGDELGNSVIKPVKYTIYIDTNDNGVFHGSEDRRVLVDYHPKANHSEVRVRVQPGHSGQTIYSASGDWGESIAKGGRRVELAISWQDLGLSKGDVVRMYVESQWHDRLPDGGDIQWTQASIMGHWLLAAGLLGGGVALWYIRRRKEAACPSGLE